MKVESALSRWKKRKRRQLADIDVEEISLVDKAATGLRFAVVKSASPDLVLEIQDQLKQLRMDDEDIIKVAQLSDEAAQALKAAIKSLLEFKDDYPEPILAAIQNLVRLATAKEGNGKDYGYGPEGKPKKKPKKTPDYAYGYPTTNPAAKGYISAIEKAADDDDGEDKWPSCGRVSDMMALAVNPKLREHFEADRLEKALAEGTLEIIEKADDEPPRRGFSKQLRAQDDDGEPPEEEDHWPSVGTWTLPFQHMKRNRE
jgi:hypothetical protein